MNTITIDTISYPDCTIGRLWCDGFQCFTLELPWADNKQNMSCIPSGQYKYKYKESPNHGRCLQLEGVEGRTLIQVHSGNYTRNTLGCILVGAGIVDIDGDGKPDVTNSRTTLDKLLQVAGKEGIIAINGDRRG